MCAMNPLSDHLHIFLNSNIIELLHRKHIFTVLDFLNTEPKLIEKASSLTFREILAVRKELLKKYSARPENGIENYQNVLSQCAIIPTGIKDIDNLLEGGLFTGNIYEVCGLPSSGKTLFCLTLLKNMASTMKYGNFYYLDTKSDFQATKLKKMLSNHSKEQTIEIMNSILVKRIRKKHELLNSLQEIKETIQNGSIIKLIIIDSLPPLYQQSSDPTESNGFLNYMVNAIHFLVVKCNVAVIITNLITLWNDGNFKNKSAMKERIACGGYWYNVPNVRLHLNSKHDKCSVTLKKSLKVMPTISQCLVGITDKGFI